MKTETAPKVDRSGGKTFGPDSAAAGTPALPAAKRKAAPNFDIPLAQRLRTQLAQVSDLLTSGRASSGNCGLDAIDHLRRVMTPSELESSSRFMIVAKQAQSSGKTPDIYWSSIDGFTQSTSCHHVLVKDAKVYDPFIGKEPIGFKEYKRRIAELNPVVELKFMSVPKHESSAKFQERFYSGAV